MRVFLDANILVSVLNKEYPMFTVNAKVMSLAGYKNFKLFTSPLCLGIAFYFSEKKSGTNLAKKKIELLLQHLDITTCGPKETKLAIENKQAHDFEDALQYYSALSCKCDCIVSNDVGDYYYTSIEAIKPDDFLKKYL